MTDKYCIYFERKNWTPDQSYTMTIEDKIWQIKNKNSYNDNHINDRRIQNKVKDILLKEFQSIKFISPTSVYFYFSEPADAAFFVIWSEHNSIQMEYKYGQLVEVNL